MKKFFTLIAAAFVAMSVNAKETIDITSISTDGVITFSGAWQWKGITYANGEEYADKSAWDYVVVEYTAGDCSIANLVAQYEPDGTTSQWGANYYNTTASCTINPAGGIMAVQLDKTHAATMNAIALQNQSNAGTITVKEAYFATEAEYQEAKEAASKIEKTSVVDQAGGTHTLAAASFGWDAKWLDMDVTDFNTLVFEIASVNGHGQIVVQGSDNANIDLPQSEESKVYTCDISTWTKLSQYAFQNVNKTTDDAADIQETTIVVTKVYLTSKSADDIVAGIKLNAVDKAEYNANAPIYNLSGQKVDASYKGIVIQNGKKFAQK